LAQFYFNLWDGKNYLDAGGQLGVDVFNAIVNAKKRGVTVSIVVQTPGNNVINDELRYYMNIGIKVMFIEWDKILQYGILHTKMIIADNVTFYVGSANTDWASLIQVKEMGIYVKNNPSLAMDATKIFNSYWVAATTMNIPNPWPIDLYASYNESFPLQITTGNFVYFSVSPPQFVVPERSGDIDILMQTIKSAQESVSIEVMDYFPGTLYEKENFYWPDIDDKLREAAFRGVKVRFLVSKWNHTNPKMYQYLSSLNQIKNIQVRIFFIEEWVPPIPFTRVNHAKFLVTESKAFISTSNWSADYFLWTGGVSLNWEGKDIVNNLQAAFDRDWNSPYVKLVNCTQ